MCGGRGERELPMVTGTTDNGGYNQVSFFLSFIFPVFRLFFLTGHLPWQRQPGPSSKGTHSKGGGVELTEDSPGRIITGETGLAHSRTRSHLSVSMLESQGFWVLEGGVCRPSELIFPGERRRRRCRPPKSRIDGRAQRPKRPTNTPDHEGEKNNKHTHCR